MPRWDVGALDIFLLFLLGRDMLATDDGLVVSSNSIAAAKTLEPCVGVVHGKADLENKPQPPTWRRPVDFLLQEHGVPRKGPKGFERKGLYA
jgi:hypothetical protein